MLNILKNFLNDVKKNYKTLILAFVLAAAFWLFVSIQVLPSIERTIDNIPMEAPLTEYMSQHNLQIVNEAYDEININIEGKRYDISGLGANDFSATVDLASIRTAGSYTLPISVSSKSDRNCTVTNIEPSKITLEIDEIISKEFPINGTAPDILVPEGYYPSDITTTPSTITLTGSASKINQITEIEARSTLHGEISETNRTGSEIFIYGADGVRILPEGITLSTNSVSVNVPIFKQKELPLKFTLNGLPSNFDAESLQYEIWPKTLTIAAPDASIDNLSELNIGAIDISDITINSPNSYIPIVLPEGYKNLSGNNTARIEWKINDYTRQTFTVDSDNFDITNVPNNFDVQFITSQLEVTIVGPAETISDISASDITVTANLLGQSIHAGSQDVPVTVRVKGTNQTCWASGSYKVTVNALARGTQ